MTVEKMLGSELHKRVDYLWLMVIELSRIAHHLICNGIVRVDIGAYSGFLYLFEEREKIYDIFEEICGARLTTNIGRIGGFERDFSDKAFDRIRQFMKEFPPVMNDFEKLFNRKDRKRVVEGKSVSVGVDIGGRRTHKNKNRNSR